mmetsp:Transcript_33186/g.93010  ORF Transcript_33186/g.93010 Transcript_33186/m.93010 type:complete len:205 (-) Transcript_33186:1639-2253(-)
MAIVYKHLEALAGAPSKAVVEQVVEDCFEYRRTVFPAEKLGVLGNDLSIPSEKAVQVVKALTGVIRKAVYDAISVADVAALFPEGFHPQLGKLLSIVIHARLGKFRQACVKSQCSMPRLRNFEWRLDMQTSSNHVAEMSIPSVIVQLEIEKDGGSSGAAAKPAGDGDTRMVAFELSEASLATMLEGLGKIRDQLNNVAHSSAST